MLRQEGGRHIVDGRFAAKSGAPSFSPFPSFASRDRGLRDRDLLSVRRSQKFQSEVVSPPRRSHASLITILVLAATVVSTAVCASRDHVASLLCRAVRGGRRTAVEGGNRDQKDEQCQSTLTAVL